MFVLVDCHRYVGSIVDRYIGVLSHTFTVTFARTWNIHRHTRKIVISRIVMSGFHCNWYT